MNSPWQVEENTHKFCSTSIYFHYISPHDCCPSLYINSFSYLFIYSFTNVFMHVLFPWCSLHHCACLQQSPPFFMLYPWCLLTLSILLTILSVFLLQRICQHHHHHHVPRGVFPPAGAVPRGTDGDATVWISFAS